MWFIYLFRWPGVRGNKQILNDYIKLYAGTIETIVKQEDPKRPFMMSSPSNGVKTEQEGGLAKSSNPQSTFYGDSKLSLHKLGILTCFVNFYKILFQEHYQSDKRFLIRTGVLSVMIRVQAVCKADEKSRQ